MICGSSRCSLLLVGAMYWEKLEKYPIMENQMDTFMERVVEEWIT